MPTQPHPPSGTPPRVPVRVLAGLLALIICLTLLLAVSAASPQRTGILVFSRPEAAPFLAAMTDVQHEEYPGFVCIIGQLSGQPIALLHSPPSMINAAMNTQRLIDRCGAARLIVSGTAGALVNSLPIGAVVIPAQWGQHQQVAIVDPDRPPLTVIAPSYGLAFPQNLNVQAPDQSPESRWFLPVSVDLLEAARSHLPEAVIGGVGVSGQAFVDEHSYRAYLADAFGAQIVDMESAAVAQVAYANGISFLAVRAVSDRAGGGEAGEIYLHYESVAEAAAQAVMALLAALD
jgi:adenosylhomocysteine nucleosidase